MTDEPPRARPSRRALVMASVGVVLATVATFGRGVPQPLVESWDDGRFLLEFEPVQSISLEHLRIIWTEVHFQAWHPLHLMSYWLDVPWSGPSGPVQHAVSLGLWALALLLVLQLMRRLGLPLVAAVLATLVYGLHPVQVEAVTWASGRKEILALAFSALAMLAHLHPRTFAEPPTRAMPLLRRALPVALYLLAAMSKTTVLPLPGVLLLADGLLREVPWRRALLRQLPALVLGAVFAVVVMQIWQGHEMIRPDVGETISARIGLVASTITHRLATAVLPASLSPVYPIHRGGGFGFLAWIGPLALAAAAAVAYRLRARRALFAMGAFVVLLLPVSNVVPVYFQHQDRYLSLPLLPLAFGLGAAVDLGLRRGRRARIAAVGLAALAVVALAARTVDYQTVWRSDEALWVHATTTHPEAFYAWMKLGEWRRDHGDLEGAIEAYRHAVEVAPDLRLGHAGLFYAVALRDEERQDIERSRALALSRRYHASLDEAAQLRTLAGDMVEAGYRDAALLALGRALALEPVTDERLEQAAAIQLENGNEWLARFYLRHMGRDPVLPEVRAFTESAESPGRSR